MITVFPLMERHPLTQNTGLCHCVFNLFFDPVPQAYYIPKCSADSWLHFGIQHAQGKRSKNRSKTKCHKPAF